MNKFNIGDTFTNNSYVTIIEDSSYYKLSKCLKITDILEIKKLSINEISYKYILIDDLGKIGTVNEFTLNILKNSQ